MTRTKLKLNHDYIQNKADDLIANGLKIARQKHSEINDMYANLYARSSGARSAFIGFELTPSETMSRVIGIEIACELAQEVVSDNWNAIKRPYIKPA
jgi:hypothetical protein